MYSRNIRVLEMQEIGMSALFILPVSVAYFRDEIGLTYQDFLFTEAIFGATILLMEVPSGWIADIWQRRHSLMMANIFWIAGLALLLVADSFVLAAMSQSMIGVGFALRSGANTAMLYDSLALDGHTSEFARLEGRRKGFALYTSGLSAMSGGFLYEVDHQLPLVAAIAFSLFALIASLFYQEPDRVKALPQKNPLKDLVGTMRFAITGNAQVGMIIVVAAVLFSSTKNIHFVQQPYYIALDLPEYSFGLLLSVGLLLGGLASQINHRIGTRISNMQLLGICWIVAIVICLGSAFTIGISGVILLMFGSSFLYGLTLPRVLDAINKRVGPERRATILSTASLGREITFIPLSLIVGWAAINYGVDGALYSLAIWMGLIGLGLLATFRKMWR